MEDTNNSMMERPDVYWLALLKVLDLYGEDYLSPRRHNFFSGWTTSLDHPDRITGVFFLFEGRERTDLIPNDKGWTVYAIFDVDPETSEVTVSQCVLPDGTVVQP